MLNSLQLGNFTVFAQARFEFSPGLSVLIGENGTGKTQMLKAAYAMMFAHHISHIDTPNEKSFLYTEKFNNVFKPEYLYSLCKHEAIELHVFTCYTINKVNINDNLFIYSGLISVVSNQYAPGTPSGVFG